MISLDLMKTNIEFTPSGLVDFVIQIFVNALEMDWHHMQHVYPSECLAKKLARDPSL